MSATFNGLEVAYNASTMLRTPALFALAGVAFAQLPADVTGWQNVKWAMTVSEASKVLGTKCVLEPDMSLPKTGWHTLSPAWINGGSAETIRGHGSGNARRSPLPS